MVRYNESDYYYVYNVQGDVVALVDRLNGCEQVVEYAYDAWGKQVRCTGSMADTLDRENPFRYRGYVYDEETGLYYLRSRYYNPVWGRFLNADLNLGKVGQPLGHNAYTYCLNSAVCLCDPEGTLPFAAVAAIPKVAALVGTVIVFVGAKLFGNEFLNEINQLSNNAKTLNNLKDKETTSSKVRVTSQTVASDLARTEENDNPQYWEASIDGAYVYAHNALTFTEALARVESGGNVLAAHFGAASTLAGFNGRKMEGPEKSGPFFAVNFLWHFHTMHRNLNVHIFFLGVPVN